jgi:AAHS family 4-hydroxybenzoate transporter-like MFS transporter
MTIALWVTFFSSLIALYFFNNWLPILLTGGGLTKSQIVIITTALPFGGIIGTLVAARIVLQRNGFGTACAGYLLAALAMIVLGLVGGGFVVLALCTLLVGLFLIGTQSVLNASCAAVYPPSMRATGVGWGFGIGRIGSVISPAIAGYLVTQHWQPSALFMIAAIPTLVASAGAYAVLRILTRPVGALPA